MVSYCELPEPVVIRRQLHLRRSNRIDIVNFLIVYIIAIAVLTWPRASNQ